MNSTDKLFLLDAYALIYRSYYAFIKNPRINSKGFNTSAILGFVNTLEEVLKKENPTHIGVAFDPSGPTFRHEAYEQYKAQREETPEAIRLSVPIIKDIIRAYRIPILEVSGYRSRRCDRVHFGHRSRKTRYHHLYDDARQRLRPTGIGECIHVPPQTQRRIRSHGHRGDKSEVRYPVHRASHRHVGIAGRLFR